MPPNDEPGSPGAPADAGTGQAADAGPGQTSQAAETGQGSEPLRNLADLKKATAQRDEYKSQLDATNSRLAELEQHFQQAKAAEAEAREKELRVTGKFDEIIEARDTRIRTLESEFADALGSKDSTIQQLQAEIVERDILGAIAVDSIEEPKVLRALYRDLAREEGWTPNPENRREETALRVQKMRETYPERFGSRRPGGGSPSPLGTVRPEGFAKPDYGKPKLGR